MQRLPTLCLLIFCLILAAQSTYAQEGKEAPLDPAIARFTHLTTSDGLANAHVEVIYQDSQGFMWFGTRDGLSRYDGYHFTTYRHNPDDRNSLRGNTIFDIIEDSQGRLWFSAKNGLSVFDPRLEKFGLAPIELDSPIAVFSLFEDSQGQVWLGTNGDKLLRYNPVTEHITSYPFTPDMSRGPGSQVWDIIEDQAGNLWLAASSGVIKFDPLTEQFTRYVPDGSGEIRVLYEDEAGHIWFSGPALHQLDPVTENITNYQLPAGPVPIVNMLVDQNRQVWLATLQGLFRFDLQTKQFTDHFTHRPGDPNSLNSDRTFSLFEDEAGLIWIGTDNAGLSLFDPRQSQFTRYQHDPNNANTLGAARVTSIAGDEEGGLWLGTDNILNYFDPVTGQIEHYRPTTPAGFDPFGITAMRYGREGQVWFGLNNQLHRFNPEDGQFTVYDLPGQIEGPPNPFASVYQDETGVLWIGRQRQGFFLFDPHTETFQPPPAGIDLETVKIIYGDQDGALWLAGHNTLNLFDPHRGHIDKYQASYGPPNVLFRDRRGSVWIGADDGLHRFNPATANFTHYTDRDGLPSSSVRAILVDRAGNFWLSTAKGLAQFDPYSETFRSYDVDDGLTDNDFIFGSAWQDSKGRMYFGGEHGLTAFYPDQVEDNAYQPPVILTEVRLFNKPLPIGQDSPLTQAINFTDQLTFNHDQDIVSFEFAALNYAAPDKNRYRYMLEGFEEGWNEVDSERRFATYTNLPPGDYVLRVQGSNNSGLWSQQEATLNITILPPWWETTWFRVLGLVGLAGLIYGGYRWRVYALEQYSRQLETEVAGRTQDLQESEERFATVMNSFEAIVYVADMETYELLFINNYTRRIFGDIEGQRCWQTLQTGQTGPCDFCTNKYLVNNGVPTGLYTWELQNTVTGRWYQLQDQAIRWVDGRLVRLEVATDITELKETEEDLRQARHTAETANRAKSAFLANMSHELRTPLNAIIGFAQIIARSKTLPAEQHQHLKIINRSGEHLLALINQVLELSKIEAGRMALNETDLDLHQLLTELEGMFRLRAEDKRVRLIVERSPDVPRAIRTDEVKLRQVLINLLNNALKFTKEGSVTLRVGVKDQENQPPTSDAQSPISICFEVSDTGPGITPTEIPDLFEAFSQTKTGRQAQEGTGLGLPISRKFVQLLGGDDIRVESPAQQSFDRPGGPGATFAFDIQAKVISSDTATRAPSAGNLVSEIEMRAVSLAPNQPRYRILIVDDDATNRQLLRELLAPFGFDLREAENGQQAIDIWQEFGPHLIWMDMRMPVLDGYEATKRIKKAEGKRQEGEDHSEQLHPSSFSPHPSPVIIALTASSFEEEKAEILAAGCDDFLRKPFREAELFRLMSQHIGVQFIHETVDPLPPSGDTDKDALTPDMLMPVPLEQLTQLAEAIELSDVAWATNIINDIQPTQPELAAILSRLVNNFEYSTLLAAIGRVTSPRSD